MNPDVFIKIRFKTTAEGGRKTSLKQKIPSNGIDFYSCPMVVDEKAYDCRLLIGDKEIELGKYYEIPVIFLNKDDVLPYLFIGKKISLWEGKIIADGEVIRLCKGC